MSFKIVTWNTNKSHTSHRLSDSHWTELKSLDPSLIVLTECANYGIIPAWVTGSLAPRRGVAIAVSVGSLQTIDVVDLAGYKTVICEWQVSAERRILVAGVHVHDKYGSIAEACLRGLRKKADTMPTIVAGDFNINPNYSRPDFARFDQARTDMDLRSCWHEIHKRPFGGEPPTWRNYNKVGNPRKHGNSAPYNAYMIDYLLVSPHFSIIDADVAEMENGSVVEQKCWINSDHKAVWAEVGLKDE